jgi:hypothetical protein
VAAVATVADLAVEGSTEVGDSEVVVFTAGADSRATMADQAPIMEGTADITAMVASGGRRATSDAALSDVQVDFRVWAVVSPAEELGWVTVPQRTAPSRMANGTALGASAARV